MDLFLRDEISEDYSIVEKITFEAFDNNDEVEIVKKLRDSPNIISLVAEDEGQVIAHIMFSEIDIVDKEITHKAIALAPMSVSPSHQKQGVGKMLITFGINRCKELGYPLIIVLGHVNYYPKFGFVPAYPLGFTSIFNVTSNAWMVLELTEGKAREINGEVIYHSAFF